MTDRTRRIAILAEGALDFHHGKTAVSLLRYQGDEVVAVIDSAHAGMTTAALLGFGPPAPILGTMRAALTLRPTEVVIGIAPRGGSLPDHWRRELQVALRAGVTVVSGLHTMLNQDPELVAAARASGAGLVDVRRPPEGLGVAGLAPRRPGSQVLTFVGSDCAVGKMTAALELTAAARNLGLSAEFVATGQTGIMIAGRGIAIDRVIGDFMAGAIEGLVLEASARADWVFVEGQGSLLHPAYSGVTLGLLHGSAPDALVLVHPPGHDAIDEYPVRIPSLPRMIEIYEEAAGWVRPAPVVAIALNTRALDSERAEGAIARARAETGLPVDDPVRFGATGLMRAIEASLTPAGERRQP